MSKNLSKRLIACLAGMQLLSSAAVYAETLKGSVIKEGEKERSGLSRTDIGGDPNADPFSDDEAKMDEVSAPSNMYKMDTRKPPLQGNVNDQGKRPMQNMQPRVNPFEGDSEPMPVMQQPPPPPLQQRQHSQDPDSSPEMQVAWDLWHRRVAEAIYTRFNFLAKLGFRHSPPLLCQVAYVVSRDGQIQNIQVQQKSTNVLFNVIVYQTVKSLNGDINLLQFPQGSRRMFVPKVGTFTQNYGGDGFKYTVGDKETLQGR